MKLIKKSIIFPFLRENAVPLLLSFIIFHVSFFGTIIVQLTMNDLVLTSHSVKTENMNIHENPTAWYDIFTHNFFVLFPAFIGVLSFGFISFWYIVIQGYLLGITISTLLQEFTPLFVLKYTLPHGVFEILAISFLGAFSFKPGTVLIRKLFFHKEIKVKKSLRDLILLFLLYISFLFLSALIEGYVTPYI